MYRSLLIIVLTKIIVACSSYPSDLKHALLLSGQNQEQLKDVLVHYALNKKDSLKYEAAVFLIKNMPGHYSLDNKSMQYLDSIVNSIAPTNDIAEKKAIIQTLMYNQQFNDLISFEQDITTVTSEYLIHHIDFIFNMKEQIEWLKDIPKDIFFEYLLPYNLNGIRLNHNDYQTIELNCKNIQELSRKYDYECFNIKEQIENISYFFLKDVFTWPRSINFSQIGIDINETECLLIANYYYYELHHYLLPLAIDFTPYWLTSAGRHFWVSVIDPAEKEYRLNFFYGQPMPKIYRLTYSTNNYIKEDRKNYIPPLIASKFIRDVTEEYITTKDVKINFSNWDKQSKYAYAAIFKDGIIYPCAWGEIQDNGDVTFSKLAMEVIYVPIYFNGTKRIIGEAPFMIERNGNIKYFKPNMQHLQNMTFTRNSRYDRFHIQAKLRLIGLQIQASNDSTFTTYSEITTLHDIPNSDSLIIKIKNPNKYRYIRLTKPTDFYITKIHLSDNTKNIPYSILESNSKPNLRILQFGGSALQVKKLTLDCKETRENIELIIHITPNSAQLQDNREYTLLYFNLSGWTSIGKKYAHNNRVVFDSIPTNAILWLKDSCEDHNRRLFSIENEHTRFY